MIELHLGDCLEILSTMPEMSVDAIVTDPPYGLSFMGKKWDYDVPDEVVWRECLRVLKPGGHLLCFAGTRTQHRMAVRIEDAGFEIRDMIAWVYGSGFPKSADVSKAIDKAAGAEREVVGSRKQRGRPKSHDDEFQKNTSNSPIELLTAPATDAARQWQGWGTALKPALEPITMARKPLEGTVAANVLQWGTGGINVDGCRVGYDRDADDTRRKPVPSKGWCIGSPTSGSMDDSALQGRWPANLIHDGSDEVVGLFPVTKPSKATQRGLQHSGRHGGLADIGGNIKDGTNSVRGHDDNGGNAARFFFRAEHEKEDLLFCRAKAILSAWKLTKADQLCSQENASVAESSLCLSRQAAVSVLSDAVIAVSRGDKLLSDVRELSMTVTEIELERLCETLITAMLISESVALPAPSQDALIQNGCRVSVAAIQKPTDTMTITISLPTSGGYAEPVTFSIIASSMAHGAKDLSADRFRYCAKASKADRDEGCEGMQERSAGECVDRVEGSAGMESPRAGAGRTSGSRNFHPTVKPTDLMRYLCRLVTPPGGIVLDPFMGSGSTGKAAMLEGFNFIGIEREPEYMEIAKARIHAAIPTDNATVYEQLSLRYL